MAKKFNTFHTSTAFGGYHSALGNFPKPKPAAPPAAAAPAAPAPAGVPFDASAQTQVANAQHTYDIQNNPLSGYQYQLAQLDFNYNSPLNPFNRAAMLQRAYQQGVSRNTNSYAARGQLYAGSLQNAQNAANFGFQQSSASSQQAYQDAKARILQAQKLGQASVDNTQALASVGALNAQTPGA